MHKRFAKYVLVGLAFGVFDWYYLNAMATFPWGNLGESFLIIPIILALNYGIWLLLVVPVATIEARRSQDLLHPALAAATVWSMAIFSYYVYYAGLLAFIGLPHMDHLLWMNRNSSGFWQEWSIAFQRIILSQFLEWIVVAIVAGGSIGLFIGYVLGIKRRREILGEGG
jgi:hypothetical protein